MAAEKKYPKYINGIAVYSENEKNSYCHICPGKLIISSEDHLKDANHLSIFNYYIHNFTDNGPFARCKLCSKWLEYGSIIEHAVSHKLIPWYRSNEEFKVFFTNFISRSNNEYYCHLCCVKLSWYNTISHLEETKHQALRADKINEAAIKELSSPRSHYKRAIGHAIFMQTLEDSRCALCCVEVGVSLVEIKKHTEGITHVMNVKKFNETLREKPNHVPPVVSNFNFEYYSNEADKPSEIDRFPLYNKVDEGMVPLSLSFCTICHVVIDSEGIEAHLDRHNKIENSNCGASGDTMNSRGTGFRNVGRRESIFQEITFPINEKIKSRQISSSRNEVEGTEDVNRHRCTCSIKLCRDDNLLDHHRIFIKSDEFRVRRISREIKKNVEVDSSVCNSPKASSDGGTRLEKEADIEDLPKVVRHISDTIYECTLCRCQINGKGNITGHINAAFHQLKLSLQDKNNGTILIKNVDNAAPITGTLSINPANSQILPPDIVMTEAENFFWCETCSVKISGYKNVIQHVNGLKHSTNKLGSSISTLNINSDSSNGASNEKNPVKGIVSSKVSNEALKKRDEKSSPTVSRCLDSEINNHASTSSSSTSQKKCSSIQGINVADESETPTKKRRHRGRKMKKAEENEKAIDTKKILIIQCNELVKDKLPVNKEIKTCQIYPEIHKSRGKENCFRCDACNIKLRGYQELLDHVDAKNCKPLKVEEVKKSEKYKITSGKDEKKQIIRFVDGKEVEAVDIPEVMIRITRRSYHCLLCKCDVVGHEAIFEHAKAGGNKRTNDCASNDRGLEVNGNSADVQELPAHIVATNEKGKYWCKVCSIPLDAYKTVFDHNNGSKHAKKMNLFNPMSSDTSRCDSKNIGRMEVKLSENFTFNSSLFPGITVITKGKDQFWCNVCSVNISGPKTVFQHVNSPKHVEKMNSSNLTSKDNCSSKVLTKKNDEPIPTIKNEGNKRTNGCTLNERGLGLNGNFGDVQELPPHIVATEERNRFWCEVCSTSIHTYKNIVEHTNGSKHKKNVNLLNSSPGSTSRRDSENMETMEVKSSENFTFNPSLFPGITVITEGKDQFWCEVCSVKISGPKTVPQHVNATKHTEKMSLMGLASKDDFSSQVSNKKDDESIPVTSNRMNSITNNYLSLSSSGKYALCNDEISLNLITGNDNKKLNNNKELTRESVRSIYSPGDEVFLTECRICEQVVLGDSSSVTEHVNSEKHEETRIFISYVRGSDVALEMEPKLDECNAIKYFIAENQIEGDDNLINIVEVPEGETKDSGNCFTWCSTCCIKIDDEFHLNEHLKSDFHLNNFEEKFISSKSEKENRQNGHSDSKLTENNQKRRNYSDGIKEIHGEDYFLCTVCNGLKLFDENSVCQHVHSLIHLNNQQKLLEIEEAEEDKVFFNEVNWEAEAKNKPENFPPGVEKIYVKNWYLCRLCDRAIISSACVIDHVNGNIHSRKLEKIHGTTKFQKIHFLQDLPEEVKKMDGKDFFLCTICNVSITQRECIDEHVGSLRHKNNGEKIIFRTDDNLFECKICSVKMSECFEIIEHLSNKGHREMKKILKEKSVTVPKEPEENGAMNSVNVSCRVKQMETQLEGSINEKSVDHSSNLRNPPDGIEKIYVPSYYRCKLCNREVVGKSSIVDHLNGKAHKRMMYKVQGDEQCNKLFTFWNFSNEVDKMKGKYFYYCTICNVLIGGPEDFFDHATSLKHKNRGEKVILRISADLFECKICKQTMSGFMGIVNHFITKKHRAEIKQFKKTEKHVSSNVSDEHFQEKTVKLQERDLPATSKFDTMSAKNSTSETHENLPDGIENFYVKEHYFCKLCDVEVFSESEVNQHINGKHHLRQLIKTDSMTECEQIVSPRDSRKYVEKLGSKHLFSCTICNKRISGPDDFEEHVNSSPHKDNGEKVIFRINEEIFECKICDQKLNGYLRVRMHLRTGKHRKAQPNSEQLKKEGGRNLVDTSFEEENDEEVSSEESIEEPGVTAKSLSPNFEVKNAESPSSENDFFSCSSNSEKIDPMKFTLYARGEKDRSALMPEKDTPAQTLPSRLIVDKSTTVQASVSSSQLQDEEEDSLMNDNMSPSSEQSETFNSGYSDDDEAHVIASIVQSYYHSNENEEIPDEMPEGISEIEGTDYFVCTLCDNPEPFEKSSLIQHVNSENHQRIMSRSENLKSETKTPFSSSSSSSEQRGESDLVEDIKFVNDNVESVDEPCVDQPSASASQFPKNTYEPEKEMPNPLEDAYNIEGTNMWCCLGCGRAKLFTRSGLNSHLQTKSHRKRKRRLLLEAPKPPNTTRFVISQELLSEGIVGVPTELFAVCKICECKVPDERFAYEHVSSENHRARKNSTINKNNEGKLASIETFSLQRYLPDGIEKFSDQAFFLCTICNTKLPGLVDIELHIQTQKHKLKGKKVIFKVGEDHFRCQRCYTFMSGYSNLVDHLNGSDHFGDSDGKLASMETFFSLQRYLPDGIENFSDQIFFLCTICNIKLPALFNIEQHIQTQEHKLKGKKVIFKEGADEFHCQKCCTSMSGYSALVEHLNCSDHSGESKPKVHENHGLFVGNIQIQQLNNESHQKRMYRFGNLDLKQTSVPFSQESSSSSTYGQRADEFRDDDAEFVEETGVHVPSPSTSQLNQNFGKHEKPLGEKYNIPGTGIWCCLGCNTTRIFNEDGINGHVTGKQHWKSKMRLSLKAPKPLNNTKFFISPKFQSEGIVGVPTKGFAVCTSCKCKLSSEVKAIAHISNGSHRGRSNYKTINRISSLDYLKVEDKDVKSTDEEVSRTEELYFNQTPVPTSKFDQNLRKYEEISRQSLPEMYNIPGTSVWCCLGCGTARIFTQDDINQHVTSEQHSKSKMRLLSRAAKPLNNTKVVLSPKLQSEGIVIVPTKTFVVCKFCECELPSQSHVDAHVIDENHRARKNSRAIIKNQERKLGPTATLFPKRNLPDGIENFTDKDFCLCTICRVKLFEQSDVEEHIRSSSHKLKGKKVIIKIEEDKFRCARCLDRTIVLSGYSALVNHLNSSEHSKQIENKQIENKTSSLYAFFRKLKKNPKSTLDNLDSEKGIMNYIKILPEGILRIEAITANWCIKCNCSVWEGNLKSHPYGVRHRNASKTNKTKQDIHTFYCELCDRNVIGKKSWADHESSANHKRNERALLGASSMEKSDQALVVSPRKAQPMISNFQLTEDDNLREQSGTSDSSKPENTIIHRKYQPMVDCNICRCKIPGGDINISNHRNSKEHKGNEAKLFGRPNTPVNNELTVSNKCTNAGSFNATVPLDAYCKYHYRDDNMIDFIECKVCNLKVYGTKSISANFVYANHMNSEEHRIKEIEFVSKWRPSPVPSESRSESSIKSSSKSTTKSTLKRRRERGSGLLRLFKRLDKNKIVCPICHTGLEDKKSLHSHMTKHFWTRFTKNPAPITEEIQKVPAKPESLKLTEDSDDESVMNDPPTKIIKPSPRSSRFRRKPLDVEVSDSLDIYEIDKQKMNEVKAGVLLSLPRDNNTTYCLICRRDVSNNLQTFYEHLCSVKHLDYLKDMLEDDKLFQDCENQFSDLALGYEYMEDISKYAVKCHACKISVSNNFPQLNNHINSASHIDNWTALDENSRDLFKELKSKMECNFYSVRKYWCVVCSVKFITECEFQKHLKQKKHLKKTQRFSDEFLMFDYCGVCASLWYGFLKTFSYHSECSMHKYHKLDGFFSVSKLPESAERLLNSTEEKIGAILKDLEFRRSIERIKEAQLLHDLKEIAVEYYPNAVAHPFGSRITGLGGINSDLDVFLDCPTKNNSMYFGTNSHPKLIERRLEKIKECLENNTNIWHIDREILDCRIPIIKTKHKPTDIDCDLSFTNGLTVENTSLIRNYCDKSSDCRKLIIFIKNWMNHCELSGANGINSYGITWLVIYFLQTKKILPTVNQLIEMKNQSQLIAGWETGVSNDFQVQTFGESFGELLKQFFTFYGNFDYRNDVICPLLGEIVKKIDFQHRGKLPSTMWSYSNYLYDSADAEPFRVDSIMCLQDPFDLAHNITKAVKKFKIYQFKTFCCYSAQILDHNP